MGKFHKDKFLQLLNSHNRSREGKNNNVEKAEVNVDCINTTGENYRYYNLSPKETKDYYIISIIAVFGILYAFYGTVLVLLPALGAAWVLKPIHLANKAAKRRAYMREQFGDFLYSISASISGGRHMFSSLKEAEENLRVIYPDDSPFIAEIRTIVRIIEETRSKEENLLKDFGERSGISDIKNFFEVYYICRDTGGDLVRVVNKSVEILTDKMAVQRDIEAYLAQKRFESKIIGVLPIVLIYFLQFMSPDYLETLYGSLSGILIMTASLLALAGAYYWAVKMLRIENYNKENGEIPAKASGMGDRCKLKIYRPEEIRKTLLVKIPIVGTAIQKKQRKREQESVKAALPDFTNQLVLLVNAGMVLTAAFEKIVRERENIEDPMQQGLQEVLNNMKIVNSCFNIELRKFAVKTGVKEFIRLANIVNDNYAKGADLIWKLEGEASMMWYLNKKEVEEKGRVAESKMTFPMAIMLMVLVTITTTPALMQL